MRLIILACCVLLAAAPLFAHHSFGAEYDANKPITLTGIVTSIQWTNPHFYFFMDVKDQNDNVANWKFEGYPPVVLNRVGWKRTETMLPGDSVTVFGWQARDGSNWAHSRFVTFAKNDLGELSLYPNQFVQTPNLIVILIEVRHAFRLIPLNEKHSEDLDPAWLGDSVGHWEGDTLVVDVVGFKERLKGSKINTDALHIVERFTRVDYNTIEYSATIEDPKALLHPYTITSKYMLRPGTRLQEYVCENNQDPASFEELDKKGLITREK